MTHLTTLEMRGNALPRFLVQGFVDPVEVDDAIEKLIAFRDAMDPDLEGTGAEDCFDTASITRYLAEAGAGCPVSDPAEDDDPSGQRDEDEYNTGGPVHGGPGCLISDSDRNYDE